ncbi:MAG TPA: universal stress protein [Acidobacteriaceae bacterium]|nr:universal stress protein [Acidobacteriaceae bacterium]
MTILGKPVEVSIDTILFATDFSASAETAKLYVRAIAERYHSLVRLMHVVDLASAFKAPDAGISIEIFRRFGEESLGRLQTELASDNIKVETILSEGTDPAQEILEAAQAGSIDLLVIGTRAHKGLARLVLGSTAEMLIHRAACPIFTVGPAARPPESPMSFRRIVYATDFSPEAAKAGAFATSFAQDSGAHLYLCHVVPAPDGSARPDGQELNESFMRALEQLVPNAAREWCEPECILEHGYAADGILLLAQRVKADLIVVGTRRTSHWYDNFKTGVAFQVISSARCPVLTVRG